MSVYPRNVAEVRVNRIGLLQIACLRPEHAKPHQAWAEYFMVVLVTAVNLDLAARSPDFLCHHRVGLCAVDASD